MKFVKPGSNKQSKNDLPPFDLRFFPVYTLMLNVLQRKLYFLTTQLTR